MYGVINLFTIVIQKNKQKRSLEIEYIYGIVTTGEFWLFLIFTSENDIAVTKHTTERLEANSTYPPETKLKNSIRNLVSIIRCMIIIITLLFIITYQSVDM